MRVALCCLVALLGFACASDPPRPPESPVLAADEPRRQSAKPKRKKKKRIAGIPRKCGRKRGECLPPSRWVKRLCEDIYPDVALHMFRPGTPWKRLYMLARAEAFNASGGSSLIGERLERDRKSVV